MQEAFFLMIGICILEGFSSALGGFLIGIFNPKSNHVLAGLYELSAGMMTGIVCFEMLPDSFEISNIWVSILGILTGIGCIYILDVFVQRSDEKFKKITTLSMSSLVIIIAMAGHNITEGIAIGSSSSYSVALGITIIISIFLHNIPEGMVVAISMKKDKKSLFEMIKYSAIVGIPTGFGAFFGKIIGDISDFYVALSLSFSAGAMLYIVACDLIPSSKLISKKKIVSTMYIVGIIIAIIVIGI